MVEKPNGDCIYQRIRFRQGKLCFTSANSVSVPPSIDALAAEEVDVFEAEDFGLDEGLSGDDDIEELDGLLEELGLTGAVTN